MHDLIKRLNLMFLLLVHNTIFHINEWVCTSNFFTKLHPSRWTIVKKIQNSSFYKTGASFFKTSCNTVARFLGFKPVFEVKPVNNTNVFKNIVNNISSNIENVCNLTQDFEDDYTYWNNLISNFESMKLHSTKFIYNFLDSWHKEISNKIDATQENNNLSDLELKKILDSNVAALCSLSNATQTTLRHFDELQSKPGAPLCIAKNCHNTRINYFIEKIRQKHSTLTKEICSYKNRYNTMKASSSLSSSLG